MCLEIIYYGNKCNFCMREENFTPEAKKCDFTDRWKSDNVFKTRRIPTIFPKLHPNQFTSKHRKISKSSHPEEAQRDRRRAAHHLRLAVWIQTKTLDRTSDLSNGRVYHKRIQPQERNRSIRIQPGIIRRWHRATGQIQVQQATHPKTPRRSGDTGKMVLKMENPAELLWNTNNPGNFPNGSLLPELFFWFTEMGG